MDTKKKTDVVLVAVTVILVIVLAVGFIYDRNSALLDRTNFYPISEDENLQLEKINKVGFLYMRAGYEARVRIKDGKSDEYIIKLAEAYGGAGQVLDYDQYKKYEADVLSGCTIKPNPLQDSFIWILGAPLEEKSTKNIVYIVTVEGPGEGYIYMYYSRK